MCSYSNQWRHSAGTSNWHKYRAFGVQGADCGVAASVAGQRSGNDDIVRGPASEVVSDLTNAGRDVIKLFGSCVG